MTDAQIQTSFQFDNHQLRLKNGIAGTVWVARDVCGVLGIGNYRDAIARLDEDERASVLVDTPGGEQTMAGVTEPGLYKLILRSRKKDAKRFQRWVTHDVLPAIRRGGRYEAVPAQVPQTYIAALEETLRLAKNNENLQAQVAGLLPDAQFARNLRDSSALLTFTQVAKQLRTGPIKLSRMLRDAGVIRRHRNSWYPTHKYQDAGYFRVVTFTQAVFDDDIAAARAVARESLKITEAGRRFVHDLYNNKQPAR